MSFHGSYLPQDVEFLLTPLSACAVENPPNKEYLIQSGRRHYSEFLVPEKPPPATYKALFFKAHAQNRTRMARDCAILATHLSKHCEAPTLVSLARAGTPVGVILQRLLRHMGHNARHFSISIIRDRGVDHRALDRILADAHAESLFFVDGWTGKGVIAQELRTSLSWYAREYGQSILPRLCVLSDLAGVAWCAAGSDDYLIPSSILNAPVSGLVSRTVLNDAIGPGDYHGCVYYSDLASEDVSCWFVDDIERAALPFLEKNGTDQNKASHANTNCRATQYALFIAREMARYGILDRNRIKPGIGEATRVLLRRLPDRLIVKNLRSPDVAHLLALAEEKGVAVENRPDLPLSAMALIRSATDA
jgi:hypothetical protein